MVESDVARLRKQIELEYEAAARGLHGYAIVSRHSFIAARLQRISEYHQELVELVGEHEATEVVLQAQEKAVK